MTAAEQARAEVEAWFNASSDASDAGYSVVGWEDCRDLIARLTPVFERAQQVGQHAKDHHNAMLAWNEERERAERAEAERREMSARNVAGNEQLSVEILRREAAEADVARLREALRKLHAMPTALDAIRMAADALAATEPKPQESGIGGRIVTPVTVGRDK